jgi:hypothetical protein
VGVIAHPNHQGMAFLIQQNIPPLGIRDRLCFADIQPAFSANRGRYSEEKASYHTPNKQATGYSFHRIFLFKKVKYIMFSNTLTKWRLDQDW